MVGRYNKEAVFVAELHTRYACASNRAKRVKATCALHAKNSFLRQVWRTKKALVGFSKHSPGFFTNWLTLIK